ncbi:hypothetical protein ABZ901_25265 [Actinacidiphila alni]|uniref:hypothetical protein n=1 Tax=Actinacidiphila alni TaxID=380248 RepID=UPI0033BFE016
MIRAAGRRYERWSAGRRYPWPWEVWLGTGWVTALLPCVGVAVAPVVAAAVGDPLGVAVGFVAAWLGVPVPAGVWVTAGAVRRPPPVTGGADVRRAGWWAPGPGLETPARWSPASGSGTYGEETVGPPRAALNSSATYPAAGTTKSLPSRRTRR